MISRLNFGFQDTATPLAEGIIDLHNHVMVLSCNGFLLCSLYVCFYFFRFLSATLVS